MVPFPCRADYTIERPFGIEEEGMGFWKKVHKSIEYFDSITVYDKKYAGILLAFCIDGGFL